MPAVYKVESENDYVIYTLVDGSRHPVNWRDALIRCISLRNSIQRDTGAVPSEVLEMRQWAVEQTIEAVIHCREYLKLPIDTKAIREFRSTLKRAVKGARDRI
jgi:hypothetical protein